MASKMMLMLVTLAMLLMFTDSQTVTMEPPTDPPTEPSAVSDLVSLIVFVLCYYSMLLVVHVSYRLL